MGGCSEPVVHSSTAAAARSSVAVGESETTPELAPAPPAGSLYLSARIEGYQFVLAEELRYR